ncbi:alpha/beta hydrolase [Janibacter sp. GS2]|uniref:alpha/beta hydrolase n=1 Tax=Janibacter sp. GS2 TaxID=3442646 RepID=UPI003EBCD627
MITEAETHDRLLEDGSRLTSPAIAYGSCPEQVHEAYGREDAPTLVVVHGGYFRPGVDRTHARPQARALAADGWRVVLAEYRRVPGAPFATTQDLAALDAHLRREGHDVAVWVGHSAGGALSLWRALTPDLPPVRAVALAPVADFDAAVAEGLGGGAVGDWLGATPSALAHLDPTRLLAAAPDRAEQVHLVHGDRDAAVPVSQSEGFAAPSTVLPGAHHFDLVDPRSPHWPAVTAVINRR